MRPFRFRAEAALQLRRRQHDQVLVLQAAAERALTAAEQAVTEAGEAIRQADGRLKDAMQSVDAQGPLQWHLAWRTRCVKDRERVEALRQERCIELEQVRQQVRESHRRVKSLEQLREHALATWVRVAEMEERKVMDALAASQFVRRKDD